MTCRMGLMRGMIDEGENKRLTSQEKNRKLRKIKADTAQRGATNSEM